MKLIEAVIKPIQMDEVKAALQKIGIRKIGVEKIGTIQSVNPSNKKARTMFYRRAEYVVDFIEKIKVQILAADNLEGKVIETIVRIADTGCILLTCADAKAA